MYIGNAETRKLWSELSPWMQGAKLRDDAPDEIIEKLELWKKLMDEEEERQIRMMEL
ncbi:MAG: hypothetical protein Q4B85_11480 [Lachnospiraceae bacterium]|nr:hypothetical protein [Lachnospiraceae bacterium]